jgi:hypothetical protein
MAWPVFGPSLSPASLSPEAQRVCGIDIDPPIVHVMRVVHLTRLLGCCTVSAANSLQRVCCVAGGPGATFFWMTRIALFCASRWPAKAVTLNVRGLGWSLLLAFGANPMKTRIKLWRWSASLLAAGCLFQAGSCSANQESLSALFGEVVVRQMANVLSDTVFFLLDNALVRMTG